MCRASKTYETSYIVSIMRIGSSIYERFTMTQNNHHMELEQENRLIPANDCKR